MVVGDIIITIALYYYWVFLYGGNYYDNSIVWIRKKKIMKCWDVKLSDDGEEDKKKDVF